MSRGRVRRWRWSWLGLGGSALACVSAGQPIDGPLPGGSSSTTSTDASTSLIDGSGTTTGSGSSDTDEPGPPSDPTGPVGWASVHAEGQLGTYGGAGGETVVVATLDELSQALAAPEPLVVQVSGTITGLVTLGTSNKTLEGLPGARIEGGIVIEGTPEAHVRNVIVRNLTVVGTGCAGGCTSADAIAIRWAHHVWIDHCDVSDGDDGNLDITREADYVTVSWTRFSYADAEREGRFSNLIGAADDEVEDADDLRVTLHHCWWADNVAQYMPRVRFGQVHVFNGYYSASGNDHCIRVGVQANVRVESSYFDGVTRPLDEPIDPSAQVLAQGNLAVPPSPVDLVQGAAFVPPYPYALDPVEVVPALVMAGAGPP